METQPESKLKEVSRKSKSGFIFYTLRSILLNVLQIISSLILAKFLNSEDYGVFGLIAGYLGFIGFTTDVGLSISLVQLHKNLNLNIYRTYFTIRVVSAVIWAVILSIFMDDILIHFKIQYDNIFYFRLIGLLPLLDILKCVPQVKMSINFQYKELAKMDTAGALALYIVQISAAVLDFGFWSFFLGLATRNIMTLIIGNHYHKAFHKLQFNWKEIIPYVKIGIFHQLVMALDGIKTVILPLVLKLNLSIDKIGLIFWMEGLVSIPKSIASNWNNVFYPSLAHLEDKHDQDDLINNHLRKILILLSVIFGFGGTIGNHIISIVFDDKWAPAMPFIFYAALTVVFKMYLFVFTSVLAGLKKPKIKFYIDFGHGLIEYSLLAYFMTKGSMIEYFYVSIFSSAVLIFCSFICLKDVLELPVYRSFFTIIIAIVSPYYIINNFMPFNNIITSSLSFVFISSLVVSILDFGSIKIIRNIFTGFIHKIREKLG